MQVFPVLSLLRLFVCSHLFALLFACWFALKRDKDGLELVDRETMTRLYCMKQNYLKKPFKLKTRISKSMSVPLKTHSKSIFSVCLP